MGDSREALAIAVGQHLRAENVVEICNRLVVQRQVVADQLANGQRFRALTQVEHSLSQQLAHIRLGIEDRERVEACPMVPEHLVVGRA